ncbi:PHP domain-containing protein [Halocynthiibacter namhaensis]|uniref:PHP domain-containing protein n=1 Tax=Halocynthiibacter namhaensis TaxID=1290553 RepID=UPI000578F8B2|nr:CehA/McbA family metallohydrolase [Halocynthiibacter namhaensis]
MIPTAYSKPGRFFRGNLHTHSTLSDGLVTPEEVCRRYKAEGYDFISLTDHFVGLYDWPIADTTAFHDDEFTTIAGAELHSGAQENGDLWHIVAVGLPKDFAPSKTKFFSVTDDQETGPEIAQRARDAGAYVILAHPEWSGLTNADARSIEAAHAVEGYNHSCYVDCARPDGCHTLDVLLMEGRRVNLVATDDAHFNGHDAFGGWVMVKAEKNDPELLLEALKAGDFYSSQGPEIRHIEIKDKKIHVECSAAARVIFQGVGCKSHAVFGESMTRCETPLNKMGHSKWFRVTVVDRAGKMAWSNPIWLD